MKKLEHWHTLKQDMLADHAKVKAWGDRDLACGGGATIESALKYLMGTSKGSAHSVATAAQTNGLFLEEEAKMLAGWRLIRNHFAHGVDPSFQDEELVEAFDDIETWLIIVIRCSNREEFPRFQSWLHNQKSNPEKFPRELLEKSLVVVKAILANKELVFEAGQRRTVTE